MAAATTFKAVNSLTVNLFLVHKYKYVSLEDIGGTRSRLKSILETPWYDIAVNLAGKVYDDNTFMLYPKFSMGFEFFGFSQSVAVIVGKMEGEGEQTHINIEVRPNHAVLFSFYIILLIFLFRLFKLFTSSSEVDRILAVGLFFILFFIRSHIYFSMGRLRNRFERLMSLHPEE